MSHLTQTAWLRATAGAFNFYTDADAAVIAYLENSAPNGLAAFLTNAVFERDPRDYFALDISKSQFPRVSVWTTRTREEYFAPPGANGAFETRLIVWDLDADSDTMLQTVQDYAGGICSALQQTRNTSGNDWADWYANHDHPSVTISGIQITEGLARGTVLCQWTHNE